MLPLYIRYTADREEYQNRIEDLETNLELNEEEIKRLEKEVKKYKHIAHVNQGSYCQCSMKEEIVVKPFKKKIEELTMLLHSEEKKMEKLKDKLMDMEDQIQHLDNNYHVKQATICIY